MTMTFDKEGLASLLERVKAATGPDREIDGRIWCMVTPGRRFIGMAVDGQRWGDFEPNGFNPASGMTAGLVFERTDYKGTREDIQRNGGRIQSFPSSPAYTASIDASLALVERLLPGWPQQWAEILREAMDSLWAEHAPKMPLERLPLAILAALLSALNKDVR